MFKNLIPAITDLCKQKAERKLHVLGYVNVKVGQVCRVKLCFVGFPCLRY